MQPIIILAHGALGAFDEIIFVAIAILFLAMMVLSWFRSQALVDEDEPEQAIESTEPAQATPDKFELR